MMHKNGFSALVGLLAALAASGADPLGGAAGAVLPVWSRLDTTNGWTVIADGGSRVTLAAMNTPKTEGQGSIRVTLTVPETGSTNPIGIEASLPGGIASGKARYLALDVFPTLPNLRWPYPTPGALEVGYRGSDTVKRSAFKRSGEKSWRNSYYNDEWFTTVVPLDGKAPVETIRVVFSPRLLPKGVPVAFALDNLRFVDELPPNPAPPPDDEYGSLYRREIRSSRVASNPPPVLLPTGKGAWIRLAERAAIRLSPGEELAMTFDGGGKSGPPSATLLFLDGCRLDGAATEASWGAHALQVSVNGKAAGTNEAIQSGDGLMRHPIYRLSAQLSYEPKTACWFVEKSGDRIPFPGDTPAPLVGEVRAKAWSDFRNDRRSRLFRVESVLENGKNKVRLCNRSATETLVIEKAVIVSSASGLLVFSRDIDDPVHPWTVPAWNEVSEGPRLRAARSEWAVAGIGALALETGRTVSVEASSLRSASGEIGVDQIRLFAAQYGRNRGFGERHPFASPGLRGYYTDRLVALEPRDWLPLPVGLCQAYWIEVHVPSNAASGVYSGSIRVQAAGRSALSVPLRLEVLPFDLAGPDQMAYGIWMGNPSDPQTSAGQRLLQEVRDHGIDMISVGLPYSVVSSRPKLDTAKLQANIRAWREAGLKGPFFAWTDIVAQSIAILTKPKPDLPVLGDLKDVSPAAADKARLDALLPDPAPPPAAAPKPAAPTFGELFEAFIRECVAADTNGDLIYFPMDEPNSPEGIKRCAEHFTHIRKAGGRTFVTLVPSTQYALRELVDWPCVNGGVLIPFYEKRALAAMRDLAAGVTEDEIVTPPQTGMTDEWLMDNLRSYYYGPGDGTCALPIRLVPGIVSWRMKEMKSLFWWALCWGKTPHLVWWNDDGTIDPRPGWEGFRQGVTDYRYLSTLLALLEPKLGREKALADVNSLLPLKPGRLNPEDPRVPWTPSETAAFRDRIIQRILDEQAH